MTGQMAAAKNSQDSLVTALVGVYYLLLISNKRNPSGMTGPG